MRAWLYTGPLGHLVAGVLDWLALIAASVRARVGISRLWQ
jgi:hypothetical protein